MAFIGTPLDTRNTFQSLQGKRFNGDGSTTAFTLDVAPASTLDIEVFVGNVRQDPNSAYTLSGTTLTFTGAPPSGTNNIYVVHQAKSVGTIDVPTGGVQPGSLASNVISGQTLVTLDNSNDHVLINDATDGALKKALIPAASFAGIDDQSSSNDDQLTIKDAEVIINEDSDDVDFRVESNGNTHMLFVDGGNNEVGINTSAAAATLHVQEATTTGTSALFVTGTNSGLDGGTGTIRIRNTANRATTRGPFIGFDVATRTNDSGTVEDGSVLACVAPNATDTDRKQDFLFRTRNSGTAEHFRIAHDGTLTATDTSIGSNSDSRLKDNIQDYSYDISKFKSFKPRTFTWKNPQFHNAKFDGSDNQIPTRGFVAQELNSVDDYWTDTVAINDIDTADYNLIPANSDGDHVAFTAKLGKKDAMYISIIQQLITRIEALEE